MEDIIINGVSVNNLKSQREAIRQGAASLIAEKIDLAKSLTEKLIVSTDVKEIEKLAEDAYEALDTASVVSGVSGVTFFLPYFDDSNSYEGEVLSGKLEGSDNEVISDNWDGAVKKLYDLFGEMEYQSRDWHMSTC